MPELLERDQVAAMLGPEFAPWKAIVELPWQGGVVPWAPIPWRTAKILCRRLSVQLPRPCWEVDLGVLPKPPRAWSIESAPRLWLTNQSSDMQAQDLSVLIGTAPFGQSEFVLKMV